MAKTTTVAKELKPLVVGRLARFKKHIRESNPNVGAEVWAKLANEQAEEWDDDGETGWKLNKELTAKDMIPKDGKEDKKHVVDELIAMKDKLPKKFSEALTTVETLMGMVKQVNGVDGLIVALQFAEMMKQ